jgi:fructuronate reductase
MTAVAEEWKAKGFVDNGFLSYLKDPAKISFPWTMIDKITPRPSENVKQALNALGFTDTDILCTAKNTYIAPFVNAEKTQYLAVEDAFPNGRPPLEDAGVLFTDRDTVGKIEKMKVCTCLNPLHTALAIFGCLLGFETIADAVKDVHLKKLVERIGFEEGLPVVVDPVVIRPEDFFKEVIGERFPNPYIPDTPQRIATDTSQKVGIRFGETIKAYKASPNLHPADLTCIPLAIAAWCRYLMGFNDKGEFMPLSPDPMLPELQKYVSGVKFGENTDGERIAPILANDRIFGIDLYNAGLGKKIEGYFAEFASGKGAVRATLQKYIENWSQCI